MSKQANLVDPTLGKPQGPISLELSPELYRQVVRLAGQNFRGLEQEINFRLEQALKLQEYLETNDATLLTLLKDWLDADESNKPKSFDA